MQYDPYRAHFFMPLSKPFLLGILGAALAAAQNMNEPLLKETATKVSDHVYVMMGFPNVAIVVGNKGTLVVDTGLGPRNGATIVRVAKKLSQGPRLYLTTTHFHPEHAAGDAGFPADTILIRDTAQQKEMDENGMQMVERFSKFSPLNADLLKDVKLRTPDILFTNEATLDLGGVTAHLMWLGAGHTKGDELIMVQPDSTLISGDIVQSKMTPSIFGEGGTPKSWVMVLDKLSAMHPRFIVPDHGELGDESLIAKERDFLNAIGIRATQLKRQGVSVEDSGKQITAEFKAKYPDYSGMNSVANLVKLAWAEVK
jgi:glyoxylase-like metal-dependent hydrolase (beta-lactamase superfamily II)